jgi:hypothetical protein
LSLAVAADLHTRQGAPQQLCYFGSLATVDGIKTSWLEHIRHMAARGWSVKYIASSKPATYHPVLKRALLDAGVHIVECSLPTVPENMSVQEAMFYADILTDTLAHFDFNIQALVDRINWLYAQTTPVPRVETNST